MNQFGGRIQKENVRIGNTQFLLPDHADNQDAPAGTFISAALRQVDSLLPASPQLLFKPLGQFMVNNQAYALPRYLFRGSEVSASFCNH